MILKITHCCSLINFDYTKAIQWYRQIISGLNGTIQFCSHQWLSRIVTSKYPKLSIISNHGSSQRPRESQIRSCPDKFTTVFFQQKATIGFRPSVRITTRANQGTIFCVPTNRPDQIFREIWQLTRLFWIDQIQDFCRAFMVI